MPSHPIRRAFPVVIIVGVVIVAIVYLYGISQEEDGPLKATGTVETIEVMVASEMPGRVFEVFVEEGQLVHAGDPLFSIDDAMLQTRRQLTLATGEDAIAAARLQLLSSQQEFDAIYEEAPRMAAQMQLALANAREALDDAERRKSYQQKGRRATQDTIDGTEAQLVLANEAVDRARKAYNQVKHLSETDPQRAAARAALEEAREQRDAIQRTLNWYTGEPTDIDQAVLDANVGVAMAEVMQAELEWEKWKDGPDPDVVALAQAKIASAEARLALAEATQELELEMIDLELDKFVVVAPVNGVILTRNVEPGEVIAAAAPAFTIGQLDQMMITVYVPEDRYGQIDLGDPAWVSTDSFPGEVFEAEVVRIADRAEYTPRNVQTEEGRRSTVFAIELTVVDPVGKLKPGMPTDVYFQD